jgi:hypothetical protein
MDIRVKSLDFCVKHERCEDIFCSTNQIFQIQRMFENNKLVTENVLVFNYEPLANNLSSCLGLTRI